MKEISIYEYYAGKAMENLIKHLDPDVWEKCTDDEIIDRIVNFSHKIAEKMCGNPHYMEIKRKENKKSTCPNGRVFGEDYLKCLKEYTPPSLRCRVDDFERDVCKEHTECMKDWEKYKQKGLLNPRGGGVVKK